MTRLGSEYVVRLYSQEKGLLKKFIVIAGDKASAMAQAVNEFNNNAPEDYKKALGFVEVEIR